MTCRFVLYDALTRLNKPEAQLIRLGMNHNGAFYLDGYPHIELIAPTLIENNWVRRTQTTEDQTFWVLSYDGFKVLQDGHEWYKTLKWYQKFLGRAGFII